ncbi:MAG: Nif3-like dinuclear metal center hexameric protein [Spirochaetales bacterium]|nr:Nif3-like dinuclear metal center hexameric protein [Spirochaetales bacterium]
MTAGEFDAVMHELLQIDLVRGTDASLNGLQVGRKEKEIQKVAFAVDASLQSFEQAAREDADLIFVHHGLLWSKQERIVGNLYKRLAFLAGRDLCLYAVHLPLDMHPELGNNIGIAKRLGLASPEPFGSYKGVKIGFKGRFETRKTIDEITDLLLSKKENRPFVLPFGPEKIETVGIVSGGDPKSALQAIEEELDLFITGDASHEIYHECLEAGLNVIFAGHYLTEVWGVKQVAEYLKKNTDLETLVLDIPTGL